MRTFQRAVVYGKPRQRECAAVAEGLTALGAAVTWQNHGYFTPGDEMQDMDVAVTFGQRLHSRVIAETYRQMGTPVLTVDLPPIRQSGDDYSQEYRALWLDHVNWMPAGPCPPDRLERLGLKFAQRRDGKSVLVCGQCEDDAAHGMDAVEIREWARRTCEAVDEFNSVTWRPHPKCWFRVNGFPVSDPDYPLAAELDGDWLAVVTFNSTVGLTAIMAGIPTFCDQSCFYAEIANTSLAGLYEPAFPTIGQLVRFFSRLAYSQWTFDELASGEAVDFVLSRIGAGMVPAAA